MAEYYLVKFEPHYCFHCHLYVRTIKESKWHTDEYPGPKCNNDPRNKREYKLTHKDWNSLVNIFGR